MAPLLQESSSFMSTVTTSERDSLLKKGGSFDEESLRSQDLPPFGEQGTKGSCTDVMKYLCGGQGLICGLACRRSNDNDNEIATTVETKRAVKMQSVVKIIKYTYSMALLGFSSFLVMNAIMTSQTTLAKETGGWVTLTLMWGLIFWLGMMEGGQGSLVGLQPIAKEIYEESHPIAHKCAVIAHQGDNLNRFIVGRQFLVVLVVFVLNLCTELIDGTVLTGFPDILVESLCGSGIAILLITVMLGQLAAEVNATTCMLDFVNNHFMLLTTYLSLAIESSGLLHATYLVQYIFAWTSGKSVESKDGARSMMSQFLFWGRVAFSVAILGFSCFITGIAMTKGQTTMYGGVPLPVTFFILFFLVCFLGVMEAMQIALFAVVNLPKEAIEGHKVAKDNCELVFRGQNFQAFLIGRQICVTLSMFLIARITTLDVDMAAGEEPIFGISAALQNFFNTGLPGALMTTVIASLFWRIFAASFPVPFMSSTIVTFVIRLCLFLESLGLFSAAWVLAELQKNLTGLRPHDLNIGDPHGCPVKDDNSTDDDTTSQVSSEDSAYGAISV